jgi:hypothetical protein
MLRAIVLLAVMVVNWELEPLPFAGRTACFVWCLLMNQGSTLKGVAMQVRGQGEAVVHAYNAAPAE